MNLETFKQTVIPTLLIPFKVTEKGFYRKYKLQSIYKTEFPFNKEFERFFLIEDNMYKLSDSTWNDVNQAFKEEKDVNEVLFQHKDKILVNVPLHKFILVNEAETENLIVVPKDRSSETIVKEYQERYDVKLEPSLKEKIESVGMLYLEEEKINKTIEQIDEQFNIEESIQDLINEFQQRKDNLLKSQKITDKFVEKQIKSNNELMNNRMNKSLECSTRTTEQYEQEQMDKWGKIDAKVEQALKNIDDKLENERIMREAKNMVDNSLETTKDFQDFISHRLQNAASTLIHKGREYTNTNWLDNFEDACRFKGLEINCENLIKVLDGYRLKHQVSIMKLQKDIINGESVSVDLINEKYGDLMNYNLLEQAIITKYNYINKVSF